MHLPRSPHLLALVLVAAGPAICQAQRVLATFGNPEGVRIVTAIGDLDQDGSAEILAFGHGGVVYHGRTLQILRSGFGVGPVLFRAGDLDGDGIDDFCSASPSAQIGVVFLHSSKDGSILREIDVVGGEFDHACTAVPDLDGDGVTDLFLGAPADDSGSAGGQGIGAAHVFSGATGNPILSLHGDASSGAFGTSVALGPDLDGDGVRDLLVGDPLDDLAFDDAGGVWVFSGATGSAIHRVTGLAKGERLGAGVTDARADTDGDGVGEFLASGNGGKAVSRLVQYSGATGIELRSTPAQALGLSHVGDLLGDGTGVVVTQHGLHRTTNLEAISNLESRWKTSAFGDFDGDGYDDFLTADVTHQFAQVLSGDPGILWREGPDRVDVGDVLQFELGASLPFRTGLFSVLEIDGVPMFDGLFFFPIVAGGGQIAPLTVPPEASGHAFRVGAILFGGPASGALSELRTVRVR